MDSRAVDRSADGDDRGRPRVGPLEDRLIERYVAGLREHGVDPSAVTYDDVRRGYLEGLLFYAVSFGASLLTIDPANERGIALFEALVHRTFAAVDDHAIGSMMGLSPS